jgi:hypothetical protein
MEECKCELCQSYNFAISILEKLTEENLASIALEEILPFRDTSERKDKFKFDERVMKLFSKNIANAILKDLGVE